MIFKIKLLSFIKGKSKLCGVMENTPSYYKEMVKQVRDAAIELRRMGNSELKTAVALEYFVSNIRHVTETKIPAVLAAKKNAYYDDFIQMCCELYNEVQGVSQWVVVLGNLPDSHIVYFKSITDSVSELNRCSQVLVETAGDELEDYCNELTHPDNVSREERRGFVPY